MLLLLQAFVTNRHLRDRSRQLLLLLPRFSGQIVTNKFIIIVLVVVVLAITYF